MNGEGSREKGSDMAGLVGGEEKACFEMEFQDWEKGEFNWREIAEGRRRSGPTVIAMGR
jgi:hypothetical protein